MAVIVSGDEWKLLFGGEDSKDTRQQEEPDDSGSDAETDVSSTNDAMEIVGGGLSTAREHDEKTSHPYHCYLMVNFSSDNKTNTYIGRSRNPVDKVKWKNDNMRAKRGMSEKDYWKLELVIGPFETMKDANRFKTEWKTRRGIRSRREGGVELACQHNKFRAVQLNCWDIRLPKE